MKHLERALTGNNFIPWYILVIVLTFVAQLIISVLSFFFLDIIVSNDTNNLSFESINELSKHVDKNLLLLTLMIPFAGSLLVFMLLVWLFHKRTIVEIINGTKKMRWNRLYTGFLVWTFILAISTLVEYMIMPEKFIFQFDITKFIPLFFIALIFIPLQTTFEEVLFRGYLAQGVGSIAKNRGITLVVTSFIFAVVHMGNPEIGTHGQVMFFNYLAMAIIWGLICILDDGLEIAMGMHAANNIFIALFTTEQNAAFETYAVFEVGKYNPYIGLILVCITGTLAIAFFYKKYNWSFSTLDKKIEKPVDSPISIS